MKVREATSDDTEACVAVLASLPDYFTESTHDEVRAGMADGLCFVADDDSGVVGFVLVEQRYANSAEITHAAVRLGRRGQGIGTEVLEHVMASLADAGVIVVEVKTLDHSAGYEPYEATRAFWERRGFVQIDCIDPLPGWEPGNPSAIYIKALHPS